MLSSKDFKLAKDIDDVAIGHFDKYSISEYKDQRFTKSGDTLVMFRSWIARKFHCKHAPTLFKQYVEWYKKETGSVNDVWRNFVAFIRSDFDLLFGYKRSDYLIRVPIIKELFEDRKVNAEYISAVREAIYSDLRRNHRYKYVDVDYGIPMTSVLDLIRVRFKLLIKRIREKYDNNEAPSYSDIRAMVFMYDKYNWISVIRLINNGNFKLRSGNKRVRRYPSIAAKNHKRKVKGNLNDTNDKINIKGNLEDITDSIWDKFYKEMNK